MEKLVFISYSSIDKDVVDKICDFLEDNSISCFIAHRDIPKGIEWADVIPDAIRQCKCFLSVYSKNFNESKQVTRELTIADNAKKPMITFRIDKSDFQNTKEYYLASLNWIDSTEESSYANLLQTIRGKLSLPEPENKVSPKKKSYIGIWIAASFLIFFIAGFIHANIQSSNEKNLLKSSVQRVQRGRNPDILVYKFSDELIAYNTKNYSIQRYPNIFSSNNLLDNNPQTLSLEAKMGYVGLGVLISKAFKVKVSGKSAVYYYVAAAVAIIAGYGLGYYIHEKYFPVEDSDKLKDYLLRKENWRAIHKQIVQREQFLTY